MCVGPLSLSLSVCVCVCVSESLSHSSIPFVRSSCAPHGRWRAFGFALPTRVPRANAQNRGGAGGSERCSSPRLLDVSDARVLARARAAAAHDPFGALAQRLYHWVETNSARLWRQPLEVCWH